MRRLTVLLVLSALAGALAAGTASGVPAAGVAAAAEPPPSPGLAGQGINFVSVCRFSHRAQDDPIVFPGKPGRSHDHTFLGNEATDAFSTPASLRGGETTCHRAGDTAAYWAPTLFVDGEPVEPQGANVYYRRLTAGNVEPFPAGLMMIAGDAMATEPQSRRVTRWSCGIDGGVPPSSDVPVCGRVGVREGLRLSVTFPSCWNGVDLDSADHKSHLAYATRGRCPSSHPVAVPSLTLNIRYAVTGAGEVELASGGQYSGHADFVNAWDQQELARLVDACLNALVHCGVRGG